ncbi:MAG: hypothetical protein HOM96_04605 [Rickettsiales bacterium]|jgi:hypothetical protein|nr:hypothetical protein [Rickettsiales bacterium]
MKQIIKRSIFNTLFYFKLILIVGVIIINVAYAAELSVSTDRHEIYQNETFNIEITITNASLKSNLDLSDIQKSFKIIRQMRSSSHTMINKKTTRNEILQLQLKALKTGKITFPSLSVDSSAGILTSKTFVLNIKDSVGTSQDNKQLARIEAEIEDTNLYLGEYAILKLKISLFSDIHNAQITLPKSDLAIIEKIYSIPAITKTINGKRIQITELVYKIKPVLLKDIILDQIILTGQIRKNSHNKTKSFFSHNNLFFSYDVDEFRDISIVSNKIPTIKILELGKANIASTEFTKLQKISNIETDINTPINLSFTLKSINNSADILPEIELPNNEIASFYKEKTLTNEVYDPLLNNIITTKTQSFTIIPKEAGDLTIDKVTIPWLNKTNNKLDNLILSEINLTIMDPKQIDFEAEPIKPDELEQIKSSSPEENTSFILPHKINYYLIIAVIMLFLYSTILTIKLTKFDKLKLNNRKEKKYILALARDYDDLKLYLFQFFKQKFKRNIENFNDITKLINELDLSEEIINELHEIITKLEHSLYSNHLYDFEFLKDEIAIKLKYLNKPLFKLYTKNKI